MSEPDNQPPDVVDAWIDATNWFAQTPVDNQRLNEIRMAGRGLIATLESERVARQAAETEAQRLREALQAMRVPTEEALRWMSGKASNETWDDHRSALDGALHALVGSPPSTEPADDRGETLKQNPNSGLGIGHDFGCTFDPCTCE